MDELRAILNASGASSVETVGSIAIEDKALRVLNRRVAELQNSECDLGEVRATLKANFGPGNRYGIRLEEARSTVLMLVQVLEQLLEKAGLK